jgi:hypothetical protein
LVVVFDLLYSVCVHAMDASQCPGAPSGPPFDQQVLREPVPLPRDPSTVPFSTAAWAAIVSSATSEPSSVDEDE